MMKVWVLQGSYEGELFSSVHLTEKGCALACIADVLEFLDVGDKETALDAMNDVFVEALIKNAFRDTDRMSSLTSYSTISSRGRKQALNYQQNIVPEALEEAAFNYMPYIEAIGGKKQAKKVRELL